MDRHVPFGVMFELFETLSRGGQTSELYLFILSLRENTELREQTDICPRTSHLNLLRLVGKNRQIWTQICVILSLPEDKEPKKQTDIQWGQLNFERSEVLSRGAQTSYQVVAF